MSDDKKFECMYQVEDGYVGCSRPKFFHICEDDLHDDMNDIALETLFDDIMFDHFKREISPEEINMDDFVKWAREVLNK